MTDNVLVQYFSDNFKTTYLYCTLNGNLHFVLHINGNSRPCRQMSRRPIENRDLMQSSISIGSLFLLLLSPHFGQSNSRHRNTCRGGGGGQWSLNLNM